jgi:hypothetical protein
LRILSKNFSASPIDRGYDAFFCAIFSCPEEVAISRPSALANAVEPIKSLESSCANHPALAKVVCCSCLVFVVDAGADDAGMYRINE